MALENFLQKRAKHVNFSSHKFSLLLNVAYLKNILSISWDCLNKSKEHYKVVLTELSVE